MDALRPLSLDQFAAMTAEMETGFPRDRVLEGAQVSGEQWELTQETWLLRMAKQGAQRKLALLDRYNELLAKHRKAAQRKMRAEKRKLKGPMPVPAEAHLSPLARARHEDAGTGATFQRGAPGGDGAAVRAPVVTPAPVAAPAWAAAPVAPPVVASAAPAILTPPPAILHMSPSAETLDEDDYDEGTTGLAAVPEALLVAPAGPAWLASSPAPRAEAASTSAAPVPASPFAPTGPAWLSGPRPPPSAPPAAAAPTGGPAWMQSSASLPAVPFQTGASGAVSLPDPPPAAPKPPASRPSTLSEASFTSSSAAQPAWLAAAAQARAEPAARPVAPGALPFQRPEAPPSATPPVAPKSNTAGALPFQRPEAPPSAVAPNPHAAGALPFQRPEAPPSAVAPNPHAAGALPFQRPEAPPSAVAPNPHAPAAGALPFQRASTVPMPPQSVASTPAAVPQPGPAAPPPAAKPRLSIEQLAWLQAQMDASPEIGRAAREQLGLSEADYTSERAYWQARFQQDRATVERYSQLFYHYRRPR